MAVEQRKAVFHCQHGSSDNIIWRVILNGTSLNSSEIFIEGVHLNGGYMSSLSVRTLLSFNETTIQCVAVFLQGLTPFQYTIPVTLLIQGIATIDY